MTAALLELTAVRARDGYGHGHGRALGGSLHGVTLGLGAGVHAVVGRPADGTTALHAVVAGRVRPRSGRVRLAGRDPARQASIRRRVAALGPIPELPDGATVEASLALAARVRGGAAPTEEPLSWFGLESLATRRPTSLALAEARAVELAAAFSVPTPLVLALHEPFCDVAIADRVAVVGRIRELAEGGCCVLATLSSPADASLLGIPAVHVLERGRLLGAEPVGDGRGLGGQELALTIDGWADAGAGRRLAGALAARTELSHVSWHHGQDGLERVVTTGPDLDEVALVVADECTRLGVPVVALHGGQPPSLDELVTLARWRWEQARQLSAAAATAQRPPEPLEHAQLASASQVESDLDPSAPASPEHPLDEEAAPAPEAGQEPATEEPGPGPAEQEER